MSALCSAKAVGEKRMCTWDVFLPASPAGLCVGWEMGPGPHSLVFVWSSLSSPSAVLSPPASHPTLDTAPVGGTYCRGGDHQLWQCLPCPFHELMDGVTGMALDSLTPLAEPGLACDPWTGTACVLRGLAHLLGFSPR